MSEMATEARTPGLMATNRATEEIERRCPALAGLWSLMDDASDLWGDAVSFAFALNEVAYVVGAQCDPTFRPAPHMASMRGDLDALAEDDDWPRIEVIESYRAGIIGTADLVEGIKIMSVLCHALEMAGESY